jgi:hypothetical protein
MASTHELTRSAPLLAAAGVTACGDWIVRGGPMLSRTLRGSRVAEIHRILFFITRVPGIRDPEN